MEKQNSKIPSLYSRIGMNTTDNTLDIMVNENWRLVPQLQMMRGRSSGCLGINASLVQSGKSLAGG